MKTARPHKNYTCSLLRVRNPKKDNEDAAPSEYGEFKFIPL